MVAKLGRHPDQDQAELEQGFAPDPVADVAEHHPAQRPGDEAHRIGREGGDDAVQRIARLGKEQLAEHQGRGRPVQEELVPLDHRPGHRGPHDLAQIGQVGGLFVLHDGLPAGGP